MLSGVWGWRGIRALTSRMLILVVAGLPAVAAAEPAEPTRVLVVVVNKKNPVQKLGRAEIRDIFLKRRQVWPNGDTIIPVNGPVAAPEKKAFDRIILGMTAQEVGSYWVKEAVTGRATPPRRAPTANLAKQIVASLPGAITYLELEKVDATVKVIVVDGLAPNDAGYRQRFKFGGDR